MTAMVRSHTKVYPSAQNKDLSFSSLSVKNIKMEEAVLAYNHVIHLFPAVGLIERRRDSSKATCANENRLYQCKKKFLESTCSWTSEFGNLLEKLGPLESPSSPSYFTFSHGFTTALT